MLNGRLPPLVVLALALAAVPASAVTITFVDQIPDGSRTAFNGFEALTERPLISSSAVSYSEDGIQVGQIPRQGGMVWLSTDCAPCFGGAQDGLRAWYPNGGDFGYTRITQVSGADFVNVGFRTGSGGPDGWIYYQLLNDNALVLSGSYPSKGRTAGYLGFAGGGFDEIRLRSSDVDNASFLDGNFNAFAVDSIETSAPEPATLLLLGIGLAGLALRRRRA